MTLDNLLGISLERIEPDPLMIQRLLQAAQTWASSDHDSKPADNHWP